MTQIITLYNNKGGVSKTTTLFNLGVYLSKKGKKILMVDCDPQCNVTELFLASNEELLEDPEKELPGTSIYQALKPRFEGSASRVDPQSITLVASSLYPNLYLFRGDIEFSRAEGYFANSIAYAITESMHDKNTYVALSRLFRDLGEMNNFDYLLCDVGPSTGAITQMVVLSCDTFFIPLTPDRFCSQAIGVLGTVLDEWLKKHERIVSTFEPFGMDIFPGKPCFLGAIMQNFKTYSRDKMKKAYERWVEKIAEKIKGTLQAHDKIPRSPTFGFKEPFVATIKDVGPIAPIAQMYGRAIFDVSQKHTESASSGGDIYRGVVWQNWVERMSEYRREIEKLADVLS